MTDSSTDVANAADPTPAAGDMSADEYARAGAYSSAAPDSFGAADGFEVEMGRDPLNPTHIGWGRLGGDDD